MTLTREEVLTMQKALLELEKCMPLTRDEINVLSKLKLEYLLQ